MVRQMKKDKKYVMESLSCGVLRVKKDNSIERLRDPRLVENKTRTSEKGQSSQMKFNNSIGKIQKEAYENPETSSKGETPEDISRSYICSLCLNKRPNSGIFEEFTYSELEAATNSFSTQNVRYIGGNQIFMGNLPNGMRIAVKDHTFYSNAVKEYKSKGIYEKEFKSEVQLLGKARHKNITILLGSCAEDGYRLLVYEYVCNGSMDQYLSNKKELPWEARVTIATGAAKGLEYLHKRNIYGNVRPNNILLTHDHTAQLAHFGLTRNQYEESHLMLKGRVKKTFEYVAPEYEDTGIDSSKSDVFSFGVVLLELITGQRSIQDTGGRSFLIWARPLLKKKMYAELIDPMVIESHDIHQLLLMVRVVEKCLNWDPDKRFSINKVVYALECISQGREIKDFSPTECF